MHPDDAACKKAGDAIGHNTENQSHAPIRYMLIGTQTTHDQVAYPDLDKVWHFDPMTRTRSFTTLVGASVDAPDTTV